MFFFSHDLIGTFDVTLRDFTEFRNGRPTFHEVTLICINEYYVIYKAHNTMLSFNLMISVIIKKNKKKILRVKLLEWSCTIVKEVGTCHFFFVLQQSFIFQKPVVFITFCVILFFSLFILRRNQKRRSIKILEQYVLFFTSTYCLILKFDNNNLI